MTNNAYLGQHLSDYGIKPSYQRIKILEFLLNNRIHPNVDQIYKELVSELPTLSKTTVYNTLNLFIEKGLVQMLTIEENETRYDIDTSVHGHFKCNNCEEIYDFSVSLSTDELKDFKIKEKYVYFKGVCKDCSTK
ncbi:Peroxide stress regulator [Candidatus Syntrophocurvum alkaliphilum]|uniref:Peroxide stress regulator n=1 Tax=Candidatus Syntrophocurvum alkaliphilum TaxID=2293317 RepID=A0A6I6DJA1_9FIRM|nr:transcriptional repressor [Candidatus Syntrophocurvum alkaliphilum]QGU00231.1 Peroxide stress regulator [Candidatus Syntrophocurvum alkaliphilum]